MNNAPGQVFGLVLFAYVNRISLYSCVSQKQTGREALKDEA